MKIFNFSLDWFKNEKIFSIYPLIYCVSWADNQHHIFKLNWRAWDYYVIPVFGSKINILFSWSWSKSLPQIKFQLPGFLSPEQLLIIIQQFWIKLHKTLSYYMSRLEISDQPKSSTNQLEGSIFIILCSISWIVFVTAILCFNIRIMTF